MRVSTWEEFEAWCEHKTVDFGLTKISLEAKSSSSQWKNISVGLSVITDASQTYGSID